MLSRYLGRGSAILTITGICFLIEAAQHLRLYDAHYDPYDFVEYVSLLLPCYVIDRWCLNVGGA